MTQTAVGPAPLLIVIHRIVVSYPSFQPPGGLARGFAPGTLRHLGLAVPSALPHDRRVRHADPDNPTRPRWLETALFTAMAVNPQFP